MRCFSGFSDPFQESVSSYDFSSLISLSLIPILIIIPPVSWSSIQHNYEVMSKEFLLFPLKALFHKNEKIYIYI